MPTDWALFVDGASIIKGSIFRIILEGHGDILIGHALKFKFTSINNQVEYEVEYV